MASSTRVTTLPDREAQRARLVWLTLAVTSVLFLFMCMLGVMALSSFISNDTVAMTARIEPLRGGRLAVLRHESVVPELITSTKQIVEGDVATTGGDSMAFLQLFDGSTVQTYFSTTLEITSLRTGRYTRNVKEASLLLRSGTAVIVTADPDGYASAVYRVRSDGAEVSIASSSKARVRVEPEGRQQKTTVTVDYGEVVIAGNGGTVRVGPGEMSWILGDETPVEAARSEEELIRNGHFNDLPTSGAEQVENGGLGTAAWLPFREQAETVVNDPGSVNLVTEELPGYTGLKAIKFQRMDRGERYIKVGIRQEINRPATFLRSVELFATVRVLRQTTPIGGPQGNLYPLTIRVIYSDSEGVEHDWKQPFYYVEGARDPEDPSQVEQGIWSAPEESFILKSPEEARDIAVIRAVEVYSYGSEFQSWVTGISMLAR